MGGRSISKYAQLISNMGYRYISFRVGYEIKRKTGILKNKFPQNPKQEKFLSLDEWKTSSQPFFFKSREDVSFDKNPSTSLREAADNILNGRIQFFSYQYFDLGKDFDWITNPDSGYKYDVEKHWTEVNDYNAEAGDIKYTWEKSRFSFIYTIIRSDYHFDEDHSKFVFDEINDWMDLNPINMGPNYKCSQEISLRILNWINALYFYKDSALLTEEFFQKVMHSIYWQLHHVYHNINFSRIAVRNNHAITETLTLYIVSTLFPQFPNSKKWKQKGKAWFEQEVEYQVYKDGTFLQFSMNYHRVLIQLLTWGIRIADLNNDTFKSVVYERAYKSVNFLFQCQEDSNGHLPNYGSNDGALFFKLSDNDYRDYRPQLNALHVLLTGESLYQSTSFEDELWYGRNKKALYPKIEKKYGAVSFEDGGYYLIRDAETLTFIRCGKHKDRPAHADNLHLDIWYKGKNILLDGGTYKYNTDEADLKYFMGTTSHNTVKLDDYDQMLKGVRFIWYDWSQAIGAEMNETDTYFEFKGKVSCFTYLSPDIVHERIVRKYKNEAKWEVFDTILNKPEGSKLNQLWHLESVEDAKLKSKTEATVTKGYYSSYYGQKAEINELCFVTNENQIETSILIEK